jgi:membrane protease YdiL (CAAX protease family)
MTLTQQNLAVPSSRLARVARSPLAWLAVGILVVGGPATLADAEPVLALVGAGLALLGYWAVMRFVARRPTPEIALGGVGQNVRLGAGMGGGVFVVSVALIVLAGGYRFTAQGAVGLGAIPGLVAVAVAGALTEELLFRGLVLQAVEQLTGPRTALVVSSVLFGLVHLANPGATAWSGLAIAIEAGGLMGAAFLWRRNLWLVTAVHATWNGLEQLVGIPVSGHVDPSLLVTVTDGPALLTGGEFGLEASVVAVVVSLLVTGVLLRRAARSSR